MTYGTGEIVETVEIVAAGEIVEIGEKLEKLDKLDMKLTGQVRRAVWLRRMGLYLHRDYNVQLG